MLLTLTKWGHLIYSKYIDSYHAISIKSTLNYFHIMIQALMAVSVVYCNVEMNLDDCYISDKVPTIAF